MHRRAGLSIGLLAGFAALLLSVAASATDGGRSPGSAGPAIKPDDLLYFFDQLALSQQPRRSDWRPRWVRRWTGDVTVRIIGGSPSGFRKSLARSLSQISDWTGHRFALADKTTGRAGITIRIVPHATMVERNRADGFVCTTITHGYAGDIYRARIVISDQYTDCLDHELMHALGFDGHWYARGVYDPIRSVLALRYAPGRAFRFTPYDAIAIRTLYHRRLFAGMRRRHALAAARQLFRRPPQL